MQRSAMTGAPVHKLDLADDDVAAVPAETATVVERLMLTNFRCYEQARIETGGSSAVLTGENGAGKTNILEALSLLTPGRGLRRAPLCDLVRRTGDRTATDWGVAARVSGPGGTVDLGTGVERGGDKRNIHIDGQAQRGQSALAEHLGAHWLTPAMDRLFVEGRSGRRRFLDRLVYGIDPAHAGRINAYEHALRERARLLRDGGRDPSWLSALEETMASKGVAVAAARIDLIARLAAYAGETEGPFPAAALSVVGDVEAWLVDSAALDAEDRFRDALRQSRDHDAEAGGASTGPHRSDFRVRHVASGQMADLCSTGEQKALLIAIVIGAARMAASECGRLPMLLLDEITAHLDPARRDALFALLRSLGAQIWITGTDADQFGGLRGHARFFEVSAAAVTPA
ncbi:MAG: DNA replication/repair protein RecF [Rhodospirillales bacterium]